MQLVDGLYLVGSTSGAPAWAPFLWLDDGKILFWRGDDYVALRPDPSLVNTTPVARWAGVGSVKIADAKERDIAVFLCEARVVAEVRR